MRINEVPYLPPPDWWASSKSDTFDALYGYKDFRIEVWVVKARVEIRRVRLNLWDTWNDAPIPKSGRIKFAPGFKVDLSVYTPGAELENIKSELRKGHVKFKEESRDDVSEIKTVITINRTAKLYFFLMEGRLRLAEIEVFSKRRGA